jgi:hypothetical protein
VGSSRNIVDKLYNNSFFAGLMRFDNESWEKAYINETLPILLLHLHFIKDAAKSVKRICRFFHLLKSTHVACYCHAISVFALLLMRVIAQS